MREQLQHATTPAYAMEPFDVCLSVCDTPQNWEKKRRATSHRSAGERGAGGGVLTHSGSQVTHWRVEQGEDVVLQHQLHLLPVHSLLEGDTDARGRKKIKITSRTSLVF